MPLVRSPFVASILLAFSFALALTSWWVPLHFYPWGSFYNETAAMLAVFAAGFAILLFPLRPDRGSGYAVPLYPVGFLVFFSIVPLLQFWIGPILFLGDAVIHSGYVFMAAFSLFVGFVLRRRCEEKFVLIIGILVLTGSIVSVALALHQWLGIEQLGLWSLALPPGGRPYANLAQSNNFATLCILGLISSVYLRETGRIRIVVLLLLAVVLIAGVAMSRSRMTFFVMLVLASWLYWASRSLRFKSSGVEVILGFVLYACMWVAWPMLSELLLLPAEPALDRIGAPASDVRLVLWQQMLDASARAGWFGWGWGQVSVAQVAVALEYPKAVYTEYSHNLFVDLVVWNGVLLGVLAICGIGWWVSRAMARIRSVDGWFGVAIILAVGVHGMFELPFAYAYFLMLLGVAAGIVEAEPGGQAGRAVLISRPVLLSLLAVCVAAFVLIFHEYQQIETDHRQLRMESAGLAVRSSKEYATDVQLLTHLAELIHVARMDVREEMPEEALERMGRIARRFAYPPALYRYALALGLNHRSAEATRELALLRQLHPPERYDEAREGWNALLPRYPQLRQVQFPDPAP